MTSSPQLLGQQLPPVAVAQGDGDRPLGLVLADDVLVEFGDDLRAGSGSRAWVRFARWPRVDWGRPLSWTGAFSAMGDSFNFLGRLARIPRLRQNLRRSPLPTPS